MAIGRMEMFYLRNDFLVDVLDGIDASVP
jgi:hypothetical protein